MRQWLHEVQSWTPSESASLKTFCARCPSAVRRNEPGSCNELRTNDPEPAAHLSLRIDASSSDADLLPALHLTIKVGLPDRFQAGRWLGRGGFGTVYEAYGCERGHSVEVKVLREPRADALVSFKELGREWNLALKPKAVSEPGNCSGRYPHVLNRIRNGKPAYRSFWKAASSPRATDGCRRRAYCPA